MLSNFCDYYCQMWIIQTNLTVLFTFLASNSDEIILLNFDTHSIAVIYDASLEQKKLHTLFPYIITIILATTLPNSYIKSIYNNTYSPPASIYTQQTALITQL